MRKTILFYIVCHDTESQNKAHEMVARIMSIPDVMAKSIKVEKNNKYFESQVFEHLNNVDVQKCWYWYEYIGILTYSIEEKLKIKLEDLIKRIQDTVDTDTNIEFIAILRLLFNKKKFDQFVSFTEAATLQYGQYFFLSYMKILERLGYTENEYLNPDIQSFVSNWWLTKPKHMLKYLHFHKKCMTAIEYNNKLDRYLNGNSYYNGSLPKEILLKMTGKPYYTLHSFLFERLPCFFFHYMKLSNPTYLMTGIFEFND